MGLRCFMKRYSVKFTLDKICPAMILITGFAFCEYCLADSCISELYQNDVICLTVFVLLGTWDRKGPPY